MRKTLFFTLFVLGLFNTTAQTNKINWMTMDEALDAQSKVPKKIIMDVYTVWCGPCKMLDKHTFENPDVAKYVNDNYYAVKFNAEGNEPVTYKEQLFENPNFDPNKSGRNAQHQLAAAIGINAYPTIVFFNENGDILIPLSGFKTPNQLELYLKLFYKDDHEKITTTEQWNEYQKGFVSEFQG